MTQPLNYYKTITHTLAHGIRNNNVVPARIILNDMKSDLGDLGLAHLIIHLDPVYAVLNAVLPVLNEAQTHDNDRATMTDAQLLDLAQRGMDDVRRYQTEFDAVLTQMQRALQEHGVLENDDIKESIDTLSSLCNSSRIPNAISILTDALTSLQKGS